MICFALPPHERIGRAIARALRARAGTIDRRVFSDGERYVRPVTTVTGEHVVVIGNTGPDAASLLDLCILLHAIRASGARTTTLVTPYFAYARQDRADQSQEPVSAVLVARLLESAGADHIVLVDPHSIVTSRAFHVPVHVADPLPTLASALPTWARRDAVIVAPDAGASDRARRLAACLTRADVVVLEKTRPRPNVARIARLRPADQRRMQGRTAILVDDIIDTAGTITAAATLLRRAGVVRIVILATHAVCSGPALERLRRAKVDRIIVSDSLPRIRARGVPFRVTSLASSLTSVISATYAEGQ
ncbi:MAG: ribose-phosphate diphosphokinase [bacterium]|nr:ribose-phosphate diphosphokinase [bacterium]